MNRRYELKQSIKNSYVNKWQQICDFREIQNLPKIINRNEYIIQAVNGIMPYETNGTGLIILTNQRIIFFDHGLFFKSNAPSIPLYRINSVSPKRSIFYGEMDFDDGAKTYTTKHILAWKCDKFAKVIEAQMQKLNQAKNIRNNSNNTGNSNNPVKELQELNQMKDNNQINQEDYQKMKNKILN